MLTPTTSASRCYSFTARNSSLVFDLEKLTFSISSERKATYKNPGSYSLPYYLPSLWKICKRISQLSLFDNAALQHPRKNPRHSRSEVEWNHHKLSFIQMKWRCELHSCHDNCKIKREKNVSGLECPRITSNFRQENISWIRQILKHVYANFTRLILSLFF